MNPQLSRLNPFIAPIASRLFGPNLGVTEELLQPQEVEVISPAVCLDGQLDRATGTSTHSTLAQEIKAVVRSHFVHAPVIRKQVKNVVVTGDGLSASAFREHYSPRHRNKALFSPVSEVEALRYCQDFVSWRYFGHWLTDAVTSALIDTQGYGDLWLPGRAEWSHVAAYRELLGLHSVDGAALHVKELTFYQDFGQGSSKRKRYVLIKKSLQSRFAGRCTSELVYLVRGATGASRQLRDEDKLVDDLIKAGWTVLDVATSSVDHIQAVLCNAHVVVSMEGSHVSHAQLALQPGSIMVLLIPNDQFTAVHLGYCNANRVSFGFVVLEGSRDSHYVVRWDEVLRTVEMARARAPELNALGN